MGRARVEDDNWFGVDDPRKRKQIQDRLAQRARRKRLAEAKNPATKATTSVADQDSRNDSRNPEIETDSYSLVPKVPRLLENMYQTFVPLWTKPHTGFTTSVSTSVYAALSINGAMMGLSCVCAPNMSNPVGVEIPDPLRPSALQLTTIHPLWFDRFPFPKLRDNMIFMMGIFDEEDFLADLFCMTSFTVDAGAPSWDPRAWKMGREFSAKWGYLFY